MYPSRFPVRCIALVLLSIVLLLACKTQQSKGQNPDQLKMIAIDKLGVEIESFPNTTGEYVLYVQRANSSSPTNVLKFLVIEVGTNKIATEQNFVPGYIKWITEFSLELLSVPGTIKETESLADYTKVINVRTTKN